jgi:uncharacterized membrane protein YqgA involved in biofilm formation
VFLSGTLLNIATVLIGTTIGLLAGARVPHRMQESLVTGNAFFVVVLAVSMAIRIFTDPAALHGHDLAILAALLVGVAAGELLHIHDGLEWLGGWFQRRLARGGQERPSRIAEGFITASLVYCVGPLTILGSLQNGLTGDTTLLATKSLLDGVTSIAFAAALGPGVYLSVLPIALVQGGISGGAFLLTDVMDATTILAITAVGGMILLGVALRLLDLKAVRVANFLPALVLAPIFIRVADLVRGWLS